MLSVLFYLRYNKKNPDHPHATVYCQVTLAGQKATPFSTGVKAKVASWHKSKSTGDPLMDAKLMLIQNRLNDLHLRFELDGKPYSVHYLRGEFIAPAQNPPKPEKEAVKPVTYLEMYSRFVASKKGEVEGSSYNVLQRYEKNIGKALRSLGHEDLLIADMDADMMDTVKKYFLSNYAESTALKMLVYAKAVVDFAVLKKVIQYSSIKPYKIGKPEDKEPVCLTVEEEGRLLTIDFTQIPGLARISDRLDRVRDIYIVTRELAFHYGDYLRLSSDMIQQVEGVWVYHSQRKKTKADIYNLVSVRLMGVFEKYGGVDNLPKMALQRYNDYLKLLFAAAGINKNGTSKMGRTTFSDYHSNEAPINDPALCAMLGLKSSKYLRKYRKVDHRALLRHFKPVPKEKND